MSSSLPELVNLCVYSTPAAYKLTAQACINKYQNDGDISICGDFNSRCNLEYFIAGVDDVPQRNVVDFKTKSYGEILIEINTNLCILNGRNCLSNDFTSISVKGLSAVDYCLVSQSVNTG